MKHLLLMAFIVCSICSFAQTKYNIVRAFAFSRKIMPGNIPVDENGNALSQGPRILHFIIIETKGNVLPQWKTASINGKTYSVGTHPVTETSLQVGQQKNTDQMVVIKPAKGNRLWQLELDPYEQASGKQTNSLINAVLLKGTFAGKGISYKIDNEVEILSLPAY